VRWPFGLEAVGHPKLEVVAGFIERNYPYTHIERFSHKLGQTALDRRGRAENELDTVARLLDGSALAIDATAERGVAQAVSDLARERATSQLYISATEGARGGQLALIVPGSGGCWHCWKQHALDGTLPLPPYEESGTVQPRGCAMPTFTGAGFDLLPLVAQAARIAAGAIADDAGALSSTVHICALPADGLGPPEWSEHPIEIHPACPYCAHD
jgi:hypothetical protein